MADYAETAKGVLAAIGGAGNVTHATHCVTRLRFNVRDKEQVDREAAKDVPGVLGEQFSGEQYQVIIGATVAKVYEEVCAQGGFQQQAAIDENLDGEKKPVSLRRLGSEILDGLSGTLVPMLPAIVAAGLLKLVVSLFGPAGMGLMSEGSDLLTLFTVLGDAAFYFLPMIVAYTGAQKFGGNPVLTITIAAIMMHPTIAGLAAEGAQFTVYGIPAIMVSYANSVFPMVMIAWAESKVEIFLTKVVPDMANLLVVPLFTILIMAPIALCAFGPLGSVLGVVLENFLLGFKQVFGPVGIGLISAMFTPLIATGMHTPIILSGFATLAEQGSEGVIFAGGVAMTFSCIAAGLGYMLKAKDTNDRELGLSCFTTQTLVGIGEPTIFGILLPNPKMLGFQMAGAFAGGVYAGIMNVAIFAPLVSNVTCVLEYAGGGTVNLVNAVISGLIAFAVTFVLTMVFGPKMAQK